MRTRRRPPRDAFTDPVHATAALSAIVDTQGHLYCSIVDEYTRLIATNLQSERWYHLTLTWADGLQHMYLDGVLAAEFQGPQKVE